MYIILTKPTQYSTTDTTTYVCLSWDVLFLSVLKKFWYELPEEGKITAPKHVATT